MSGRSSIDTPARELIISGLTYLPDVLCDKCTEYIVSELFAPKSPIIECIKSRANVNIPNNVGCSTFLQRDSVRHAPRPEASGHVSCVMVERPSSFLVAWAEDSTVQDSRIAATRKRPVGLRTNIFEAEVGKVSLPVPARDLRKRYIHTVCG